MPDDDLDRLLTAAARRPAVASEALLDRVLADALALQPEPGAMRPAIPARTPGRFARLAELFGGAPALAGLGTAAVFGLVLGYYSPTTLDYLMGNSAEAAEFFPDTDLLAMEG